jgi:hypothetical protein
MTDDGDHDGAEPSLQPLKINIFWVSLSAGAVGFGLAPRSGLLAFSRCFGLGLSLALGRAFGWRLVCFVVGRSLSWPC